VLGVLLQDGLAAAQRAQGPAVADGQPRRRADLRGDRARSTGPSRRSWPSPPWPAATSVWHRPADTGAGAAGGRVVFGTIVAVVLLVRG
jgi:hypothetical protein